VLPALRERYDLTLLDVRSADRRGNPVEGVQVVDLVKSDRDAYRRHFRGADAVVHFGFVASSLDGSDRHFEAELANVAMAYNVYQVSLEEGVRRLVAASSNHAADYFEPLILSGEWDVVHPYDRALSDNFYGWAKEAYEHLGFVFAVGRQGHAGSFSAAEKVEPGQRLEVVQIRIGGSPSISATATCSSSSSRASRPPTFATSKASPSRSSTESAPTPTRFGASPTRAGSSATRQRTQASSASPS
jgi:hypothetical protein